MKKYTILILSLFILIIQGCSHKVTPKLEKKEEKELQKIEVQKEEDRLVTLKVNNIDEINQRVNSYLNELYAKDIEEKLSQGTHYDIEYVHTKSKTYLFVKFKNSFLFCGKDGCLVKMLEYENEKFIELESFTLELSSIYLLHDNSNEGFSVVVVPMSEFDESKYTTYYNIYEPFSENEYISIHSKDRAYKELEADIKSRKKSIKLFFEEE